MSKIKEREAVMKALSKYEGEEVFMFSCWTMSDVRSIIEHMCLAAKFTDEEIQNTMLYADAYPGSVEDVKNLFETEALTREVD